MRFQNSITVEHGTTAADLKELLNDKYNEVSLGTAADSEIVSGTVVWDVTDEYNGDVAGDYTATGTATAPKYYCFAEEAAAKVARDASNQVGFALELSVNDATDLRWSKDGKTEKGLMKEEDFVYVQLDLKEYLDTPKAIYVKDGDSGDYTPVYIQVDAKILDIYVRDPEPYKTTLEARTFPDVGTVADLNLPTEVIFCADQDEKAFPISITWACDKEYGKEGAGTYTFYPTLGEKPAYTLVHTSGLDPIHIELKMGNQETPDGGNSTGETTEE